MGLIKAASGGLGGALADQWKDFFTVPSTIEPTAALFPAEFVGISAGRGSNRQSSPAIISNGSKIVVPEGYGLMLFQDGEITAFAGEPGEYIWDSQDPHSQTIFAGNGLSNSLIVQSWERFRFGGRPSSQQIALFVSLKELPNNRFGTQSEIYWDDQYLQAQVGAIAHGTYSMAIVDPILFAKHFVPATYLQGLGRFDFTDRANPAANQLFAEVVGSLAAAFSLYSNDPTRGGRIARLQQDSLGFAAALAQAVEESYGWRESRGLAISKVTIVGIEYEHATKELLQTVQRADALRGPRGDVNLQASAAAGIEAAGHSGGSAGILGIGIAAGSVGLSDLMQASSDQRTEPSSSGQDLVLTLQALRSALEDGLIDQSDFDAAKAKALGLS